jgi:hypothetical protein
LELGCTADEFQDRKSLLHLERFEFARQACCCADAEQYQRYGDREFHCESESQLKTMMAPPTIEKSGSFSNSEECGFTL